MPSRIITVTWTQNARVCSHRSTRKMMQQITRPAPTHRSRPVASSSGLGNPPRVLPMVSTTYWSNQNQSVIATILRRRSRLGLKAWNSASPTPPTPFVAKRAGSEPSSAGVQLARLAVSWSGPLRLRADLDHCQDRRLARALPPVSAAGCQKTTSISPSDRKVLMRARVNLHPCPPSRPDLSIANCENASAIRL